MSVRSQSVPAIRSTGNRGFTGAMALAAVLVSFGAVFIANGALVYYALSTFSGEEDASPYEHGLAYDNDIEAAHAQDARRWRVTVGASRLQAGGPAFVTVSARDAEGRPLEGLRVSTTMDFPTDKKFDQHIDLSERSTGEYGGEAPLRPGQWDVEVNGSRGDKLLFRSRNRLDLP